MAILKLGKKKMPRKNWSVYFLSMGCVLVLFCAGNACAATFVLDGDYIRAGVSNSGGLIDDSYNAGIQYDPTGHKNFGTADYLKPAAPLEFFSIGMGGQSVGTAGFGFGNSFNATTTNTTSAGNPFSAHTVASSGQLGITQDISFSANSSSIIFNVMFTNNGSNSITNLAYARGLDPDQDAGIGYTFETINTIYSGNAMVSAVGPKSGMYIAMRDISGGAVATVNSMNAINPYSLRNSCDLGNGDYSINLAYLIGDLGAGRTATICFAYDMKPVPVPPAALLFLTGIGGLGFLGRRKKADKTVTDSTDRNEAWT